MTATERSKPQQLASRLRDQIAADGLQPGHRMGTKADLCAAYDAGLSTVNEAIGILRSEGLVTVRTGPGGGVSVAAAPPLVRLGRKLLQLDGAAVDVADSIQIRNALEPLVVVQATRHGSSADHAALRAVVARMAESNADDLAFLALNMELHERIAAVLPDGLLSSLYVSMLRLIADHTVGVVPDPDTTDRAETRLAVHRNLVEAIITGDVDRAADAERIHRSFIDDRAPSTTTTPTGPETPSRRSSDGGNR